MATGTSTYMGLAVPLFGEAQITSTTAANDILTITGVSAHSGDFLVCEISDGTEKFVVDVSGNVTAAGTLVTTGAATAGSTLVVSGSSSFNSRIAKMVLGTVALATCASNASSTVALTGITTSCAVGIFNRVATTGENMPLVWAADADKLGYKGTNGVSSSALSVNVWYFATA